MATYIVKKGDLVQDPISNSTNTTQLESCDPSSILGRDLNIKKIIILIANNSLCGVMAT